MPANESSPFLRRFWRSLPLAGVACLIAGFAMAIVKAGFTLPSASLSFFGLLLFLTIFIRAELAYLRYYLHLGVYTTLVFGICVVVYLFGVAHNFQIDLTKNKIHTLSGETQQYVKSLDRDVTVTIFFTEEEIMAKLLARYTALNKHVKWSIHDATKDPAATEPFGENVRNGDIYVECDGRRDKLSVIEMKDANIERFFTRAIYRVTRDEKIVIYFLGGHGEISFHPVAKAKEGQQAEPSLARFRAFLEERAIETRPLDLAEAEAVPGDASMVVIAGAQTDLFESERTKLEDYIKRNGRLMVLLRVMLGQDGQKFDNLNGLLEDQGVIVTNRIILDKGSVKLGLEPCFPLIDMYVAEHPITQTMAGSPRSNLPSMCWMVYPDPSRADQKFLPMIASSKLSWAETLPLVLSRISNRLKLEPGESQDVGPKVLAMSVEPAPPPAIPGLPAIKAKRGPRMAVFGSSAFIQDSYLLQNRLAAELMLNTVKWLGDQEGTIDVPAHMAEGSKIQLDNAKGRIIFVFAVLMLPALVFFGGVSYAMLRRRG